MTSTRDFNLASSRIVYSGSRRAINAVEFSVVILNDNVSSYQGIDWVDWKDENRKKMKSQGDNWSKATLSGTDIWNCLDSHKIDRRHLVQWKPIGDALHQVSLPSHPHPIDQSS